MSHLFHIPALRTAVTQQERVAACMAAETCLRVAAIAFESSEGMMITDADGVILQVNQAFCRITGYTPDEVVGRSPRMLSSGKHDAEFYQHMWNAIHQAGRWSGEIWNRRKNGEVYPEHLTITAVKDEAGVNTHYVASLTDITLSKAASDEIKNLAFYDPLTRLPNRRLLLERLRQALAASTTHDRYGALILLDLDEFKIVNDTLGHNTGDLLLQQVAGRLQSCLRQGDTVARLGGDEFVVLLEGLSNNNLDAAGQAEALCYKVRHALERAYVLGPHQCRTTASMGATLFHAGDPSHPDEVLVQADIAMYQAKHNGRDGMRFFDQSMQDRISARAALENSLRMAIRQHHFELHFQVQVDGKGTPVGAEALVRWVKPDGSMVSPANFIPLAEETGLILPLGDWVLDQACAQLRAWQSTPGLTQLTLAINVSAAQFHRVGFGEQVRHAVRHYGIDPSLLKLELTEGLLLANIEDTIASMNALKQIGVRFSLDDFGTGYSSLQYLKRLPLDQLKIDQSFVRELVNDANDQAIVLTIIAMARSLGLEVIAEGVETETQRALLAQMGCHQYQGYLFSRPIPAEQFVRRFAD